MVTGNLFRLPQYPEPLQVGHRARSTYEQIRSASCVYEVGTQQGVLCYGITTEAWHCPLHNAVMQVYLASAALECLSLLMDRLASACVPAHFLPQASPQLPLLYHRYCKRAPAPLFISFVPF